MEISNFGFHTPPHCQCTFWLSSLTYPPPLLFFYFSRGMFISQCTKTKIFSSDNQTKHNIPNVCLPWSICPVVLSQWGHLFLGPHRRIYSVQLRVSIFLFLFCCNISINPQPANQLMIDSTDPLYLYSSLFDISICPSETRCADGFMGQRCEFKDLDGSYLRKYISSTRVPPWLTTASTLSII